MRKTLTAGRTHFQHSHALSHTLNIATAKEKHIHKKQKKRMHHRSQSPIIKIYGLTKVINIYKLVLAATLTK